jgi:iron complex outermembrane receptor protein
VNGTTTVAQPDQRRSEFSPKATLTWTVAPRWTFGASIGKAYRFATPAELYQLVSTGTTYTAPNSNLKPDNALSTELKIEHAFEQGRMRVSAFEDNVHDAIIAQYLPLVANSSVQYQYASNVDHVRARGVEVAVENVALLNRHLELSGSVTYVDARTLATRGRGQFGSAIGKRLPNLPEWRASFVASWRPNERWTATVAARYSGMMFTTLDQTDVNPNTYQGFGAWFVADTRVHCRINNRWSAAMGVDNLLNRKYFVFHPFPQRTGIVDLKYSF